MLTDKQVSDFLIAANIATEVNAEVRRIGTNNEMVSEIIERIESGEKTMTYSLPWIAERKDLTAPKIGKYLIVLDAQGSAALLLRLTEFGTHRFGEIEDSHIQREGIPLRDIKTWRPLHIEVWNEKLAPYNLQVHRDMPVWAEYFELVYARQLRR